MSPLFNASQSRRKGRLRRRQLQQLLIIFLVFLLAFICFELGKMNSVAVKTTRNQTIEDLSTSREELEKQLVSLRADLMTTEAKLAEVTQRYESDVGDNNLMTLNGLIQDRLSNGVTMDRLKQVIASASNTRNCSAPDVKRLVVATAAAAPGKPQSKVSFASGLIVITAGGEQEVNAKGGRETWYDPRKPVTVTVRQRGNDPVEKTGTLPMQHSVVVGGAEYRLTIAPGSRSYAEVTSEQCAYP